MQKEHDMPMAKHSSKQTTKVAVRKKLYWPKMKQDKTFCVHLCQVSKHKIHVQKEVWIVWNYIDPEWTMGKCFHELHDPTIRMEQNERHSLNSWSILQIGKNGSN